MRFIKVCGGVILWSTMLHFRSLRSTSNRQMSQTPLVLSSTVVSLEEDVGDMFLGEF